MASAIFYLMMFSFLAALAYAGMQVFKTNQSQERHGDDKRALARERAEVDDRPADRAEAAQHG